MKRCVLSLERKVGKEFEFRVSGGREFQSRGPMTEKKRNDPMIPIGDELLPRTTEETFNLGRTLPKFSIELIASRSN